MQNVIEGLKEWLDLTLEKLAEEWNSKDYKELSDCPSFKECSIYREALNMLIEANYMPVDVDDLKLDSIEVMMERNKKSPSF